MLSEVFMRKAIDEARKGMKSGDGGPFGAVIVKGNDIIASAHNTVLTDNDPTHHAEINAISKAAEEIGVFDLSGCEIYTTTEPCPMCFSAIHWARIDRMIFGTKIEDVKALGFNELTVSAEKMKEIGVSGVEISEGFLLDECRELLDEWQRLPEKKVY